MFFCYIALEFSQAVGMDNIKKSYIFLIIGAILIAFAPVLIKAAGVPGPVSVFYRLFFGT